MTGAGPDPQPPATQSVAVEPEVPRRRLDPLIFVLAALAGGIGLIVARQVRIGFLVCAGGLAAAAILRLTLRHRAAGSLVVRSRHADVVVLAGVAVALAVLAVITPFPRPGA